MIEVYKLVSVGKDDKYYSYAGVPEELKVEYQLGVEAFPPVGKLFCFDTWDNAYKYNGTRHLWENKILLCQAHEVFRLEDVASPWLPSLSWTRYSNLMAKYCAEYWRIAKQSGCLTLPVDVMEPPKGTLVVDSLLPIRVVEEMPHENSA